MENMKNGLLQDFIPQLKNLIKSETVFGEPYQVGEVTLIPVNSVKIGFGFGTGQNTKDGEGGGGGGGVLLTPEAFLVIKDGQVSIHSLATGSIENLMDKVPEVLDRLLGLYEKATKKKAPPAESA